MNFVDDRKTGSRVRRDSGCKVEVQETRSDVFAQASVTASDSALVWTGMNYYSGWHLEKSEHTEGVHATEVWDEHVGVIE